MTYVCEIVEASAQPTLVVRKRSSFERMPQVLGEGWGEVMAVAAVAGAEPVGSPFAAFHTMDRNDFDLEVGFVFDRPVQGAGEVTAGEIPAGSKLQCTHVGPFDQLGAAYAAMHAWMADRGLEHDGPSYEHYLDDPADTPIDEVRTLIVIPVR